MTGRDRMIRVLSGEGSHETPFPHEIPVTPHWWGLYKFAHAGVISGYEDENIAWALRGRELADVDTRFYRDFDPDMLHLTAGASKLGFSDNEAREFERLSRAVAELESYSVIDEYVAAAYFDKDTVKRSRVFDHIPILAQRHGKDALLMLNEGDPVSCVLDPHGCVGFENGLIALIEKPDMMEYLLYRCYDALLPRMQALADAGCDGYIGSETYCGADLISPDLYRQVIFGAQKEFYDALRGMGMFSVAYFPGEVMPLLPWIAELGINGLMIEEGKKNYDLNIGDVYNSLDGSVALFGNLDSVYVLQMGTSGDVMAESRRQIAACGSGKGRFIMSNGCPVSFGTPAVNIKAMIAACRS